MEELSIEQKAKAYDEAIKKAESLYKVSEPMSGCNVIIETLFPELKESEDDRIRKALINGFNKLDINAVWYNGITNAQILAWLEKQGEQPQGKSALEAAKEENIDNQNCVKPTDKIEPKFKVGDIIEKKHNSDINKFGHFTITDIFENSYWYNDAIICDISEQDEWKLVEQEPADKSDVLMSLDEAIAHCKEKSCGDNACALEHKQLEKWLTELKKLKGQKPAWSEEDEEMLKMVIKLCEQCGNEYAYYWLTSLKDRVQPQPKQEWSDKDEKMIHHIENAIKYDKSRTYLNSKGIEIIDVCNWLKSLRHQSQWKPSDEQIEILDMVLTNETMDDNIIRILRELREQLKKLKG